MAIVKFKFVMYNNIKSIIFSCICIEFVKYINSTIIKLFKKSSINIKITIYKIKLLITIIIAMD